MNKILTSVLATFTLLMSGCGGHQPMYEYADYSESYYQLKQNGDAETTGEWKVALEDSIKESNEEGLRTPPGINANLGYLYLRVNDDDKAISFFNVEKKIYPESTVFMDKLIKKAELMKEGESK